MRAYVICSPSVWWEVWLDGGILEEEEIVHQESTNEIQNMRIMLHT